MRNDNKNKKTDIEPVIHVDEKYNIEKKQKKQK